MTYNEAIELVVITIARFELQWWLESKQRKANKKTLERIEDKLNSLLGITPMDVTFIQVPLWNGVTGNFRVGRKYYDQPNLGEMATIDKIIIHWNGVTSAPGAILMPGVDNGFKNPFRRASAHFDVEGDKVHQYVKLSDTAFHCGDGHGNAESVGIELSGGPGNPVSDATYETAAKLIAELCTLLKITPSLSTILPHNHFSTTACPGTVDLARLVGRVRGIMGMDNGAEIQHIPVNAQTYPRVTIIHPVYIRIAPSTKAPSTRLMAVGEPLDYVSAVKGESIGSNDVWLLKPDGLYVWAANTTYNQPQVN